MEIEIRCTECGGVLKDSIVMLNRVPIIEVAPCESCMKDKRQEGYDEGVEDTSRED